MIINFLSSLIAGLFLVIIPYNESLKEESNNDSGPYKLRSAYPVLSVISKSDYARNLAILASVILYS